MAYAMRGIKLAIFLIGFPFLAFAQTPPPVPMRTITLTDPVSHSITTYSVPQNYTLSCDPSCGGTGSLSPDGTTSAAPNGPNLTALSGLWSWGVSAGPGRPGENYINLGGKQVNGIGSLMEVADGGNFFVKAASGSWYQWGSNSCSWTLGPP